MTRKEYLKPEMEVLETALEQQMLVESLTEVVTTGLDDEEQITLPSDGLPGNPWNSAQ